MFACVFYHDRHVIKNIARVAYHRSENFLVTKLFSVHMTKFRVNTFHWYDPVPC